MEESLSAQMSKLGVASSSAAFDITKVPYDQINSDFVK